MNRELGSGAVTRQKKRNSRVLCAEGLEGGRRGRQF